jgi:hypothetical protein
MSNAIKFICNYFCWSLRAGVLKLIFETKPIHRILCSKQVVLKIFSNVCFYD